MIWAFDALRAVGVALAVVLLGWALLVLAAMVYPPDILVQLLPTVVMFLLLCASLVPWLVFRNSTPTIKLKRRVGWGFAVGTLLLIGLLGLGVFMGYFTKGEALVVFYLGLVLAALYLVRLARRQNTPQS